MPSWFMGFVSSCFVAVAMAALLWPPRLEWRVFSQIRARAPVIRYDAGDMTLQDSCGVCGGRSGHHVIGCPAGEADRKERQVEQAMDRAASLPDERRAAALSPAQVNVLAAADNVIGTVARFIVRHRAERGAGPSFDGGGRCTACRAAREDHVGGQCV